ncbi:hypothetical protein PT974_11931 [Cladobotryum mycophilum]|uniref:HNH endonuclease n=1 Tax=Cladobotryum mycophilum TaxID=491253 RepID=A0ABR0S7J2_9HYPO
MSDHPPRRNSDNDGRNLQYYTPRGEKIPYETVERHAEAVENPREGRRHGYPARYNNRKVDAPSFEDWEKRHENVECPTSGVIYHPEGNPQGFHRAPLEPIDRQGIQVIRRYDDDHDNPQRVSTWPP